MKKPSKKPSVAKLKKDLWLIFSRYIRLRDALVWQGDNPEYSGPPAAKCVTCTMVKPVLGMGGLQAGHFIPGRRNAYLFDENQVWSQCWRCNGELKGNWTEYLQFMQNKLGQEKINHMLNVQRHQIVKFTVPELQDKIALYKAKVAELEQALGL